MKTVSNQLRDAIRNEYILSAKPRLIAEWNLNRYTTPVVTNDPSEEEEGYDPELFPIESIVEPMRPSGGIVKARIGSAKLQPASVTPPPTRYVLSSEDDAYKYWTSPTPSATGTVPPFSIPDVDVSVDYGRAVRINRIRLNFEEHECVPLSMDVYVKNAGGTWTELDLGTLSIPADGNFNFYYSGTWSQTPFVSYEDDVVVYGIRVKVNTVNRAQRRLSIVEIAGLLEKDLSPYFMEHSSTMDSGNTSDILPVGSVSSNIADITLFNALVDEDDQDSGYLFSNDNPNSPLAGLIDAGAKFTLGYVYELENSTEYVQEFVMYADDAWSGGPENTLTVSLTDQARDLQAKTVPQLLFQNKTAVEIAWRILDSVGFVDYDVVAGSAAGTPTIPYFWTDGTEKVWEVLQGLSEASQVAFYFDNYGRLQIRSRDSLFNASAEPVWTIDGVTDEHPSDLKSLEPEVAHKANVVDVKYVTPYVQRNGYGSQIRSTVWEPQGDTILGASDLALPFPSGVVLPAPLRISATDIISWPYEGYVSVQGEIMRYEGKSYGAVLAGSTTRTYHWIRSQEEYEDIINRRNPEYISSSGFVGALRIVERGLFNTEVKNHELFDIGSWRVVRVGVSSFASSTTTDVIKSYSKKVKDGWQAGWRRLDGNANAKGGTLELTANMGYQKQGHILLATRGTGPGTIPPRHYGTRLRLSANGSGTKPRAGIHVFGYQNNDRGYYIQIMPSTYTTKATKEVTVFKKNSNGSYTRLGSSTGYSRAIVLNQWYTLDVTAYRNSNGSDTIAVYIEGRIVARVNVPSNNVTPYGGRAGLFVQGGTRAQFEYFYALDNSTSLGDFDTEDDDRTFFDFVSGGYVSDPLWKNYFYRTELNNRFKRRLNRKYKQSKRITLFDEFGPVVHEMQHFKVDLDKVPTLSPTFVSTNSAGISILNFRASHKSAEFFAVNTWRENALMNGSMNVGGNTSTQKMVVLGYPVEFRDEKTVTVRNEQSIRAFGESSLEISSPWIQSKIVAENLAKWISDHWASVKSTYVAEIFGNPLLQIGDVVEINYPVAGLGAGSNKFIVMEIVNSWNNGLESRIRLRQIS